MKKIIALVALCLANSYSVFGASGNAIHPHVSTFTLKLGASRIIYVPETDGATLTVENKQPFPILVRSRTVKEDKSTAAPFMVTPPLFRLESGEQNRINIVRMDSEYAQDREELYWLCVAGIPPEEAGTAGRMQGDNPTRTDVNMEVSMSNCIKLITRPSAVKGSPQDAMKEVVWRQHGNQLIAENRSPFFMNVMNASIDGKAIDGVTYLSPYSSSSYPSPVSGGHDITWNIINDQGGLSPAVHSSPEH
ncbi:fimbria/pilus periplasmic chaperone [Klebsiella aerogenes]|nr:fimbria/pilus periplasmic chaperone [Klebsiella aerogenes]ELY3087840.1 fimbria/pilus periplasmic chaperone [Klebsiella aerogenes]